MRRLVITTLALAALLTVTSPASAARFRAYRGETSAGTKIGFVVRVADDGRMSLKELHLTVELFCEDASMIKYGSGTWFGGVGPRFDGRRLTYDGVYGAEALHITGVFRAQTADGTYENTQASLTEAEEAQICTTGDLTWTADRVALDRVAKLGSSQAVHVIRHLNGGGIRTVSYIR